MLLAFVTLLVFGFAFLRWRKTSRRRVWAMIAVLACVFSFLLAYISVSSVWIPHPLSDDVFREQNALGEYEGVFPWSELSYPLHLNVYHTPFHQLTFRSPLGLGQVGFSIFFADAKVTWVNGTFSYIAFVMGPMPLYYSIDFLFSDSPEFFDFLLVLFTSFNVIGALLGTIFAKTLHDRIMK